MKKYSFELTLFSALLADIVLQLFPDPSIMAPVAAMGDFLPVFLLMRMPGIAVPLTMFILALRITDVISYLTLKQPLNYPVFRLLAEHTEHASLTAQMGNFYYILLAAALLIILLILFFWIRLGRRSEPAAWWRIALLCVLSLCSLYPARDRLCWTTVGDLIRNGWQEHQVRTKPVRYGLDTDWQLTNDIPKHLIPAHKPDPAARFKSFTKIIVLAVESLDLQYIHAYNPAIPAECTPFLDSLVRKYPSFTNYFTGSQPTSCAFSSLILSRVDFDRDRRHEVTSLTDALRKENGFRSIYIAPTNGKLFDNAADYANVFRFTRMYFMEDLNCKPETRWGLTDETLLRKSDEIIRSLPAGTGTVCFISTMDLHHPYFTSGPAKELPDAGSPFLNALRCTDANLKTFVEKQMPLDDRTMIIITADHSATHGANHTNRTDYTPTRIPFIVITAKPVTGLPLDKYWSAIDFPATLLTQLGLPVPETFMGQDLFAKENFAISYSALDGQLYLHTPEKGRQILPRHLLRRYYPGWK